MWIRQPIVQFAAIGIALFALDRCIADARDDSVADPQRIVVSDALRTELRDGFRTRTGRSPTDAEQRALLDQHIDREIMVREAVLMGLERGDPVIRRRLIQRMEFLAEDLARTDVPDDHVLGEYLARHADRYRIPERVSAEHVFLRREHADRALSIRQSLIGGARATTLGDPFLHGAHIAEKSRTQLAAGFGEPFARAVFALTGDGWSEPVSSSFGVHLVRVTKRHPARMPALAEVRTRVDSDWRRERSERAVEQFVASLRARYAIEVAPARPTSATETP